MRAFFYILSLFGLLSGGIQAQNSDDWSGTWYGSIDANGVQMPLQFYFEQQSGGRWLGYMDSPNQNAYQLVFKNLSVQKDQISFELKDFEASFHGILDTADKIIRGQWRQGRLFNLDLHRSPQTAVNRYPQTPTKFEYEQKEVKIFNKKAKVQLAGTLTYPNKNGSFPAILLLSGSGAQDRNSEIFNHKPFLVLADYFTRNGYAVLRLDDRGVGGSDAGKQAANIRDLVADAQTAVDWLSAQPEIDKSRIGLIGHSEGGIVAPMLAVKDKRVSWIIMLAGVGVEVRELMPAQIRDIGIAEGLPIALADKTVTLNEGIYKLVLSKKSKNISEAELQACMETHSAAMSLEEKQLLGVKIENYRNLLPTLNNPSFRMFLRINPAEYLPKLRCPVLALNGSKDIQVRADDNLSAIQTLLEQGENPNFRCQIIPNLNHLFQTCQRCTLNEYAALEETFSPVAMELMLEWLQER